MLALVRGCDEGNKLLQARQSYKAALLPLGTLFCRKGSKDYLMSLGTAGGTAGAQAERPRRGRRSSGTEALSSAATVRRASC